MKFYSFLEPAVNILRGRGGSIRQRFFYMPIERIKLEAFRLTGGSWIEFYGKKLDGYASINIEETPSEKYLSKGQEHFDFLIRYGLKPDHRVLDYGCGVLRTARYLIPYLDYGNYIGMEISKKRIQKGHQVLSKAGISREDYVVHIASDCLLKELGNKTFDIIWANSVLTHMPESDIRELLINLKSHLNTDGKFFFTYSPSERINSNKPKQEKIKDFYYPTPYLKSIFEGYGYSFEVLPDGHAQALESPTVLANLL
tara:strand:+ start:9178 stop:9945 length:768 start_codon:yes stop_codon:yes gene_type:complete